MSLSALQAGFFAAVVEPTAEAEDEILAGLRAPPRGDAHERLAIYRDAYRLRMREFLASDYPALRVLAGEAAFSRLVEAYIVENPSNFRNARWVGAGLPRFLRAAPADVAPALWADVALLEAALLDNFDGADFIPLTLADLAGVAAEEIGALRLGFQPALALLELRCAAVAVFEAFRDGAVWSGGDDGALCSLLVWRNGLDVLYRALDPQEMRALSLARAGAPLAELGADCGEGEAESLALLLTRWFGDELIVAASPGQE